MIVPPPSADCRDRWRRAGLDTAAPDHVATSRQGGRQRPFRRTLGRARTAEAAVIRAFLHPAVKWTEWHHRIEYERQKTAKNGKGA